MGKIFDFDARKGNYIDDITKVKGLLYGNRRFIKTSKGQAVFFDGSSYLSSWNLGDFTSELGLIVWFNMFQRNSAGDDNQNLLASEDDNLNNCFRIESPAANPNILNFRIGDSDSSVSFVLTTSFVLRKDYFLCATWRSNVLDVYLGDDKNGLIRVVDSQGITGNIPDTIPSLVIGRGYDTVRYWLGSVLKVEVYNEYISYENLVKEFKNFSGSSIIKEVNKPFYEDLKPTDLSSEVNSKYGSELFDGSFDTDITSDFTAVESTLSYEESSYMRITFTTGTLNKGFLRVLIADKTYSIRFRARGTRLTTFGSIGNNYLDKTTVFNNPVLSSEWQEYIFIVTLVDNNCRFYMKAGVVGEYFDVDDLLVQELTGLKAAFNMIPINEIVPDISGNNKYGTVVNAKKTLKGLTFIEIGSYVQIDDNTLLNGATEFSICLRAKLYNVVKNDGLIISRGSNLTGIGLDTPNNNIIFWIENVVIEGTISINLNKWVTIIAIWNGDTQEGQIYVDGNLDKIETIASTSITIDDYWKIGLDDILSTRNFKGEISDFRLYDRVLTLDEIKSYHDQFAKQVDFSETFSDEGSDSGNLLNWTLESGYYKKESLLVYPEVYDPDEFITSWNLPSGSFTFPAGNTGTYNCEINFGDGTGWYEVTAYNDVNLTHTYLDAGIYEIRVKGVFPWLYINNSSVAPYLLSVTQKGDVGILKTEGAYYGCVNLTGSFEDIFPDNLTVIEHHAFRGCTSLTGDLIIPSYITSIDNSVFFQCNSFTGTLTLSSSLTFIGDYAFYFCTGFTGSLVIPDGVTNIGNYAFASCGFDGTLTLSSGLTTLGTNSFEGCSSFTGDLTIPSGVTIIEVNTFNGCNGFNGTLTLSSALITISSNAFKNCSSFTGNLTIPSTVTTINSGAFQNCSGFNGTLTLSSSLTSIGVSAFYDCNGFTGSLIIPNGVTVINSTTFQFCSSFDGTLTLSSTLTSIGTNSFYGCSSFTGDLTIPSTVTTINSGAFQNCSGFNGDLILSSSLTTIGSNAFRSCSGFTGDLTIPGGVTTISSRAFYLCSGFDGTLTLSSGIVVIDDNCFYGCNSFTGDLTIPASVTTLDTQAFYGCTGFNGSLNLTSGLLTIGNGVFSGCNGFIGTLTLPSTLTTLDTTAFLNCTGFTGSLIIPSGVTTVGVSAFNGCSGFDGTLTISSGVTTISAYAFYHCFNFSGSLTLPSSVTDIGSNAFASCGFDGTLTLSSGLTTLGDNAFNGCTGFTGNLTIPSGVTVINSSTFYTCTGFDGTLTLSSSLTSIGVSGFYLCSGIIRVDSYPSTAPTTTTNSLALGGTPRPLHIPVSNTGYGVSPWTDTGIFSTITADL